MALPSELAEHVLEQHLHRVAPTTLAGEHVLSVPEPFHGLLPRGGLQRGWTVQVAGSASARALAWALLGEITTAGRWVATVNVAGVSLAAASELGVAIERVLVIENAKADVWSPTMGALIGAVDVILFDAPKHRIPPSEYRKIASRCRERGTILMELGTESSQYSGRHPRSGQLQYDVAFSVQPSEWDGLERGYGHLNARRMDVSVSGRRASGRQRRGSFELPTAEGTLRCLEEPGRVEEQRPRLAVVE